MTSHIFLVSFPSSPPPSQPPLLHPSRALTHFRGCVPYPVSGHPFLLLCPLPSDPCVGRHGSASRLIYPVALLRYLRPEFLCWLTWLPAAPPAFPSCYLGAARPVAMGPPSAPLPYPCCSLLHRRALRFPIPGCEGYGVPASC